ncbi:MAG: FRG domain-containing protein [Bacteroidia bacterium]|nr:FRG domain-containing protein [Bacteroidia bacterium]
MKNKNGGYNMMTEMTERDRFNLCIQKFIDRDYELSLSLAQEIIAKEAVITIHMIFSICAQHLRRDDLINRHSEFIIRTMSQRPMELALINLILGKIESTEVLSMAYNNDLRCIAYYYIGERQLLDRNFLAAKKSFETSLNFKCKCFEYMIVELVLKKFDQFYTGKDIKEDGLFESVDTTIYKFNDLLEKLASEHQSGYVYRGQNQDYGTLLTSGYRNAVDTRQIPFCKTGNHSLHDRGNVFRPLIDKIQWTKDQIRLWDFSALCKVKIGYLLSQLFCQHCCLPTEGLDVTEDFRVAAFFSIFNYKLNCYIDNSAQLGIIYRIKVNVNSSLSFPDLKKINVYSCPFYVNGANILHLLGRCENQSESIKSLNIYFNEKQDIEDSLENANDILLNLPLEYIKLPDKELGKSRIMMQRAGLIFPDTLLPSYYEATSYPPPFGKTWDGPRCTEDLLKNDNVEAFFFRHNSQNEKIIELNPVEVFPEMDPIRSILSNFISSMSRFLEIPIVLQNDSVFFLNDEKELPR